MDIQLPWKKENKTGSPTRVEELLEQTLRAVTPSPDFVHGLRQQILGIRTEKRLIFPEGNLRKGLLVLGAFASVFFMLVTSIRVVVSILAAIGVIHQVNKRAKEKPSSPPALMA